MKNITKHIVAILLAAFLVMMGVQKFGAENVIFATIAERSGMAFFEPQIRMLTGVLELIAAILLFIPKVRSFGALLAFCLIGGAIVFHLSPWLGIMISMAPGAPATPMLFLMAVGSFVLSCIVLYQNRQSIPFIGAK